MDLGHVASGPCADEHGPVAGLEAVGGVEELTDAVSVRPAQIGQVDGPVAVVADLEALVGLVVAARGVGHDLGEDEVTDGHVGGAVGRVDGGAAPQGQAVAVQPWPGVGLP